MNNIVEFRNGDCSCVFHRGSNIYELCITKCGEMGTYEFNDYYHFIECVRECYGFNNDMVNELKSKIVIVD